MEGGGWRGMKWDGGGSMKGDEMLWGCMEKKDVDVDGYGIWNMEDSVWKWG